MHQGIGTHEHDHAAAEDREVVHDLQIFKTTFCWELTASAVRTNSAVLPNLIRVPVAVTQAIASPRRTSAPENVSIRGPASTGSDSPVNIDWSRRTEPSSRWTTARDMEVAEGMHPAKVSEVRGHLQSSSCGREDHILFVFNSR
jgi:hypothetical protein